MKHTLKTAALLAGAVVIAGPAHAETLRDALEAAYRTNPTLEGARAGQRATDESVPIQKSSARPKLETTGQYIEYVKSSSTSFIAPKRSLNGSLNLSVPIYSGGAVKNGIKAAETRVQAGEAGLRGTESSVFSQVVAAYMDVIRTEALVALAKNQVKVLTVNLKSTSDRFEIGDLTRTDVAQSQSRLSSAQSDLESAQSNLIAARENYIAVVGKAPDNLEAPPPLPGMPDSVDEAVKTALSDNPDLVAAREQARAAGYDIKAAGAGRLPTVSLFTSGTYNDYLGSLKSDQPGVSFPQVSTAVQAGVQLSLPLYQGGRPAAQQRQAQARASQALEQEVGAERSVISQVRSAYASWQAAQAIIASSEESIKAASLSLEGVKAENSVGNRTILDILNAEQELVQARAQLVTARRNAYVAGFSLLAAMGHAEARDLGLGDDGPLYDPAVYYDRVKNKISDWAHDPDPVAQSTRTVDIPAAGAEIPPALESQADTSGK
ncbi:TolC family outer membrane protein [Tsuneonella mangrovi]|uniref:TolC family outer membrane protein n=1 Tax=Tsuneonella mangrovi TaxID=1982042 RepID=UPI000BA28628|nr:TolC family outer membrane protein [Tsuneonella mangrovi]